MKRFHIVILIAILGLLAACTTSEPAAESQDTVADQTTTMDDENAVMDDESMAEEEMAQEEMADEASEEMPEHESDMAQDDQGAEHQAMDDAAMADEDMGDEAMHDEDMAADEAPMDDMAEGMALPAWGQIVLTNARTGENFSLSDFAGKTVFVEPMATWCTNCRQQLTNVSVARAQLMDENTIFVGLSLETNISDETLAEYANTQGFDWLFAVMSPEMLQELANQFGRTITSAPSTPHFVIRPDGSFTDLVTGIDSPDQILAMVQAAAG